MVDPPGSGGGAPSTPRNTPKTTGLKRGKSRMTTEGVANMTEPSETLVQLKTSTRVHKFTFQWKIDNFHRLYANCTDFPVIRTPAFPCRSLPEVSFSMRLYPNGSCEAHKKHISLFLYPIGMDKEDSKATFLKFNFSLVKNDDEKGPIFRADVQKPVGGWGWTKFISHENLFNPENRFLHEDDKLEILIKAYIHNGFANKVFTSPEETPQSQIQQLATNCVARLPNDLQKMWLNPLNSDITFVVKGKEFHAHKNMLSARSPVFDAMFASNMVEKKAKKVAISDVEPEAFKQMLRYIYTGSVEDEEQYTVDLMIAADKYQLEELKVLTEHHLAEQFDLDTVVKTLVIADLYSASHLRTKCIKYITRNSEQVMKTADWAEFTKSHFLLVAALFQELSAFTNQCRKNKKQKSARTSLRDRDQQVPATQNTDTPPPSSGNQAQPQHA